jgi:hypothetical protein
MSIHEINTHELSGDGMIIIDGKNVETVFYWLTIAPEPGPVVAEGSISGSEALLRKMKKAGEVRLALEDGPVFAIRCEGGHNGIRWVKALEAQHRRA